MMGLIGAAVLAVGVAVGLFLMRPAKIKTSGGETASATGLSITTAEEGLTIPMVLGTGRVTPNLISYDNVTTKAEYTTTTYRDGKGKKKKQKTKIGDRYFMDLYYAICRTNATIRRIYIDDKVGEIPKSTTKANDDDKVTITMPQYELGLEVTRPPTFHFVMETSSYPSVGGTGSKMTGGINPCGAIYAAVTEAGGTDSNINITALKSCMGYYSNLGYALNFVWDSQATLRQRLETILMHAGGYITEEVTADGMRLKLLVRNTADPIVAELTENDFKKFKLERVTQNKVPNFCSADYIDADKDFTPRGIRRYNLSAIDAAGLVDRTIDLSGFTSSDRANARLQAIMQEMTYPNVIVSFETTLKHIGLNVGDLVTINHAEYGISGGKMRITNKEIPAPDKGYYSFQAEIDQAFIQDLTIDEPEAPPIWVPTDYTPRDLVKVKLWEMPRTAFNGNVPGLLVLAARNNNFESGATILVSNTGSGYQVGGELNTFSQVGYLDDVYSANTYDIDDDIGLVYTPWREDPEFDTISRTALFFGDRLMLIDDELMAFQRVTLLPEGKIYLSGIMRGLFNTGKANHAKGAEIWLIPNRDDLLLMDVGISGQIKLLTHTLQGTLADADATARAYTITNKAAVPYPVARIEAVRTGDEVVITWWPANVDPWGAGAMDESYTDQYPFLFKDDFLYRIGSTGDFSEIADTTLTTTRAGNFVFAVQARQDGFLSATKTITIGADDGAYVA